MNLVIRPEIIVYIVLLQVNNINGQQCPNEYSVQNGSDPGEIIWTFNATNSNPACLDQEENHLIRICQNGKWIPSETPHCYYARSNFLCPVNFIELEDYCVYLTEPRSFQRSCSYPGVSTINKTNILVPVPVWLPIKRKTKFGRFEFTELGKLYGLEYPSKQLHFIGNKTSNSNCLTYFNNTENYSVCEENYRHLCYYKKSYFEKKATTICPNCRLRNLLVNKSLDIFLKFDYGNKKLLLFIYNPYLISHFTELNEDAVSCFTDSTGELRSKIAKKEIFKSSSQNLFIYQLTLNYIIGLYWCEYTMIGNSKIFSTNEIIAYKHITGNEYVMRIQILKSTFDDDQEVLTVNRIQEYITSIASIENIFNSRYILRTMKLFENTTTDNLLDLYVHITAKNNKHIIGEYYELYRKLNQSLKQDNIKLLTFKSAHFCLPLHEDLNWKIASTGTIATPQELCIDVNDFPVTRKCSGSFLTGAYWEDKSANCCKKYTPSEATKRLHEIQNRNVSDGDLEYIVNLYKTSKRFVKIYDIDFTVEILLKFLADGDWKHSENILDCISEIMNVDGSILEESQKRLNSTDKVINLVEEFYNNYAINLEKKEPMLFQRKNVLVRISYPLLDNITGIVLYNSEGYKSFYDYNIVDLKAEEQLSNIIREDLHLLAVLPWKTLLSLEESKDLKNTPLVIILYLTDNFFNNPDILEGKANGRVVSINLPGHGSILEEPVLIYFKTNGIESSNNCAYWKYGEESESKQGHWSTSGSNLKSSNNSFTTCTFTHLSHFCLLVMSQPFEIKEPDQYDEEETIYAPVQNTYVNDSNHKAIINIISLAGCSLTLLGMVGIFLTAVIFSAWREKIGTKILLELSITIFLEITLVQISELSLGTVSCTVLGVCLHYIVISKFSWMLVSALLQYLRFVRVLGRLPSRLLLKANILAWGFPLVPVIIVLTFSTDSYVTGDQNFCYPTGLGLYLGVLFPAGLIIFANIIIYIYVMRSIVGNRLEACNTTKSVQKLQFYLAILLFFLLGIPWIFGILGESFRYTILRYVFIYLFCLTATVQGFILFLFYVVLDRSTRKLWTRLFKNLCNR